jgi:hypothetical protein
VTTRRADIGISSPVLGLRPGLGSYGGLRNSQILTALPSNRLLTVGIVSQRKVQQTLLPRACSVPTHREAFVLNQLLLLSWGNIFIIYCFASNGFFKVSIDLPKISSSPLRMVRELGKVKIVQVETIVLMVGYGQGNANMRLANKGPAFSALRCARCAFKNLTTIFAAFPLLILSPDKQKKGLKSLLSNLNL